VYVGKVLHWGDVAAATAEAAAAAAADVVAKVYVDSVPGCDTEQLLGYMRNEQAALMFLQQEEAAVRLLATAALDAADAARRAAAATAGQQSGSSKHGGNSNNSSGSSGGYLPTCLVLEYLELGPITVYKSPCPEAIARTIVAPLLRLLKVMHSGELGIRIIHMDIKGDNLLQRPSRFSNDLTVVLADFGCCYIETKPGNTAIVAGMQTSVGTSFYKAPELDSSILRAAAGDVLEASIDCYSFGGDTDVAHALHHSAGGHDCRGLSAAAGGVCGWPRR
jgi:hypothetical protein